jgi:phage terminase large subunit-like protein
MPWIEHIRRVFPNNADHIIQYLAHRVQRPGEKINHALVLGGEPGIGKDTALEPVKRAVGHWNFKEFAGIFLLKAQAVSWPVPRHGTGRSMKARSRVTWPNGAIATMFSSEEPDRLRGPQHGACLCDELASWANVQTTFDMLSFGVRMGKHPRFCITTTPRPIKIHRELIKREGQDVVITRGRTADNADNLAPTFLSAIASRYAGTRLGRQELEGEIIEDIEGALWSQDMIEICRIPQGSEPPMKRIVVAIDPAVSVSETSDLTGIIVAGVGMDGRG